MFLSLTTLNSLRKILSLREYFLEVVTNRCEEFIKLFRALGLVRVFPLARNIRCCEFLAIHFWGFLYQLHRVVTVRSFPDSQKVRYLISVFFKLFSFSSCTSLSFTISLYNFPLTLIDFFIPVANQGFRASFSSFIFTCLNGASLSNVLSKTHKN